MAPSDAEAVVAADADARSGAGAAGSAGSANGAGSAELVRKLIHVGVSLVAAAAVWRLEPIPAAILLAAATTVALVVEVLRRVSAGFGRRFHGRLGPLLRPRETHRLTGATTLSLGYTVAAVVFPGTAALLGILLTGIADAVAAVVGKRFGVRRYPGGKSLEGSLAFLVVALALAWGVTGLGLGPALGIAALVTVLEAPTLRVDDNLYLPVLAAAAASAVAALLLPQGFS